MAIAKPILLAGAAAIALYLVTRSSTAHAAPALPKGPTGPSVGPAPSPFVPPQQAPNPFLNDPETGPFTGQPTGQTPGGIEPGNPGAFTDQDIATMGNPNPGSDWTAGVKGVRGVRGFANANPWR